MTEQLRQQVNDCILNIAKGDQYALDDLSRAIGARLMSVALSVLHNRVLAEDALQECYVKIVQNAHRFKQGTNGYAWACKIAQNVALNLLRKEQRHKSQNIDDCFFLADPNNPFENSNATLTLMQAMSLLSKTEQVLVYQKYFMDYTVRDSAKSIGKGKSTVARTLATAEEKLKKFLTNGTNLND